MITIAVTGGMGAGKTETTKIFESLGASVIHADEVAHRTYEPGGPAYVPLVDAFGSQVLTTDGGIDRQKLGVLAFSDPNLRRRLEAIVWSETKRAIADSIRRYRSDGIEVVLIEAAVLYEAGWEDLADLVVTVEASESIRAHRIELRTGLSAAEIRERFAAQLQPAERIARADHYITNDGQLSDLTDAVHAVWNQIHQRPIKDN